MADFNTPNLDYIEPEDGGSVNTWGVKLNSNFRKLDLDVNARILRSGDVFTGRVGFVAGTESLPSMFFAGDPDTSFFQEGANSISISTAGVKRISIGSTLVSIATALMINGNLAYVGTLTGGTGVINIGSGQFYKDASGNVRLNGIPSAWSGVFKAFEVNNVALWSMVGGNSYLTTNAFFNASNQYIYKSSGFAAEYIQSAVNGSHTWFTSSEGVPGGIVNYIEAMTLTRFGNFLLGTPLDDGSKFRSFGALDQTLANLRQADNGQELRVISRAAGMTINAANGTETIIFSRNALAESARISQTGFSKFSNTGDYSGNGLSVAGGYHHFQGNTSGSTALIASHINIGNGSVFESYADSAATGLLFQGIAAGSVTFRVRTNGNVETLNNSYGALSDAKLKKVVGPVTSYWEKYKLIEWVKYILKNDPTDQVMLGVIAQQVQGIFPGLIQSTPDMVDVTKTREVPKTVPVTRTEIQPQSQTTLEEINGKWVEVTNVTEVEVQVPVYDEYPIYDTDGNDTGRVHKVPRMQTITETEEYTVKEWNGHYTLSVKYSILGHIADVVLQEAMARIEVNEAEIEALKARIYALESKA